MSAQREHAAVLSGILLDGAAKIAPQHVNRSAAAVA